MGGDCCDTVSLDLRHISRAFKRALILVILINGAMFVVELTAGLLADSQALKADALDFLGDTITYAMSFAVLGMALVIRARVALIKGISLSVMGLWVLGGTLYKLFVAGQPEPVMMGTVGVLALVANLTSVLLLLRYREGDANVRSVWLCSRNDAIGNVAVMVAALGVWGSGTPWPDLIVAGIMAGLFLWSSAQIIAQARGELRQVAAQ